MSFFLGHPLYSCRNKKTTVMSTFTSCKSYDASATFIPFATTRIREFFSADGFEINQKAGACNKTVLEVTKSNLFKSAVGLKQGLEITFENEGGRIAVEVRGTVLKNQLVATTLSFFLFWPVIIPQIIGMIKQSGLDDKAIGVIDEAYDTFSSDHPTYCTNCGRRITGNPSHCPHCNASL